MKTLARIEKEPVGLSGSIHYKDADVQAVHELVGIPYQVRHEFELSDATINSEIGIVAVKFDNGATCYGFIPFDNYIPTFKTMNQVSKMSGVTRVAYFGRNGEHRNVGRM